MNKVIELMKERHIIEALKITNMIVQPPENFTAEEKRKATRIANRLCIEDSLEKMDDLNDAFFEMCYEMGMKKILDYIEKEIG